MAGGHPLPGIGQFVGVFGDVGASGLGEFMNPLAVDLAINYQAFVQQ